MPKRLSSHFEALLHHWDIEAPAAPALVPFDPPLMGLELLTILNTHCPGATSAGLYPVSSYCFCYLPLPALNMLTPWLQLLPQCGLPILWQTTVISLAWMQKCPSSEPSIYQGLSVLHLVGKLLAISYLHCLDAETHYHGWLVKEKLGFHLGRHMEDH